MEQKTEMRNQVVGVLFALGGAVLFSAKAIFAKHLYEISEIDYSNTLVLRMGFALPFYVIILWREYSTKKVQISRTDGLYILALGFLGYYLAAVLDFWGLEYIPASLERLILFIYPTMVVVMNYFVYKKPISKTQFIAIGVTYAGIVLAFVNKFEVEGTQEDMTKGVILVVLCAIAYSFYIVGGGKLIPKIGPKVFTSWALVISAIMVFIHNITLSEIHVFDYSLEVYVTALCMAIFSTVIPSFMISAAIKHVGPNTTSILSSIGPVATIIMGILILGENVDRYQVMGTAIVIIGITIVSYKK